MTEKEHQRQGLGRRRILAMGAYSLMRYGLPLYSSTQMTESAQKVWEDLEGEGLAERFKQRSGKFLKERFVLKLPKSTV